MIDKENEQALRAIQKGILLSKLPTDLQGIVLFVSTIPSDEIDADFYDILEESPTQFDLILGDVMGKGIDAEVMAAFIKERITKHRLSSNKLTLGKLAKQLLEEFYKVMIEKQLFCTLFWARFNMELKELFFVEFGFTPALLRKKNGDLHFLKSDYLPIGIKETEEIIEQKIHLDQGDQLILYSDGLLEATNPQGELFGIKRVQKALLSYAPLGVEKCVSSILKDLFDFTQGTPIKNDVTCMLIEVTARDDHLSFERREPISQSIGIVKDRPLEPVIEEPLSPVIAKEELLSTSETEIFHFAPNFDGLQLLTSQIEPWLDDEKEILWSQSDKFQIKLVIHEIARALLQHLYGSNVSQEITIVEKRFSHGLYLTFYYQGDPLIKVGDKTPNKLLPLSIIKKNVNSFEYGESPSGVHYLTIKKIAKEEGESDKK